MVLIEASRTFAHELRHQKKPDAMQLVKSVKPKMAEEDSGHERESSTGGRELRHRGWKTRLVGDVRPRMSSGDSMDHILEVQQGAMGFDEHYLEEEEPEDLGEQGTDESASDQARDSEEVQGPKGPNKRKRQHGSRGRGRGRGKA